MSVASPGRVVQLSVNPEGGVPKPRVPRIEVHAGGVVGDLQRDLDHHGGPDRAVCLFASERIAALQAEGHPIAAGTTGENLTTAGVDWSSLGAGDQLHVGDQVVLEISGPAPPCRTIADSFEGGAFKRISATVHPGWSRLYARVINPGPITVGDPIVVVHAARST
ncbi:MAG TPA: MOSC domain-containing protein [Nannocystaceae bacterium]|nr:MOSC domain-containing protein [Nannocystaceae bacterium]